MQSARQSRALGRRLTAAAVGVVGLVLLINAMGRSDSALPIDTAALVDVKAAELFSDTVQPMLAQFCYDCHGDGASAGDLELDAFASADEVASAKQTWAKVIRYARTHVMPPPEAEEHPTQDERDKLVSALHRVVYRVDPANPDPGRVTLRRLNRAQYSNTIRDLLGVEFDATLEFPEDDTGYGFDNIGDVLTLPPMLMEKYLAAAEKVLDEAIPTEAPERRRRNVRASRAEASRSGLENRDGWITLSSGNEDTLSVPFQAPVRGEYVIRVLAHSEPAAGPVVMSLIVGSTVIGEVEVTGDESSARWYEASAGVSPGSSQMFRVALRRQRGHEQDRVVMNERVGARQPGRIYVREIVVEGPMHGAVQRFSGGALAAGGKANRDGERWHLFTGKQEVTATFNVPVEAEYVLRAAASGDFAGDEPPRMQLLLDGEAIETFEVNAPGHYKRTEGMKLRDNADAPRPRVYEVRRTLPPGEKKLTARFINDAYDPDEANPHYRDRNLIVHHLEVVDLSSGPMPAPMTPPMRELFTRRVGEAHALRRGLGEETAPANEKVRALLGDFALRAWRRPALEGELDRLMRLYDFARQHDEGFHGSVKHAMKAVLVSSSFLFLGEPPAAQQREGIYAIDEFELASRLSYFLWSSMPDDELLRLAGEQKLRENLDAQITRMIASPRADALVENFAGQWLQFRNLDAAHPDRKMFEIYDDGLRESMKRETHMFIATIMREDRSLLEILTGDYTFVNERLAKHYGFADVSGNEFRRVSLADTPRRGVLTHGSVLTLTSNPTRTSPVKRGKWVLENLLHAAPPDPPPDIPELEGAHELSGTVRQRLEQHRADPGCASCHAPMDPIGFGLENFDPIGRWREKDGADEIDATSAFTDGSEFTGAIELAELLARTRKGDFYRSLASHALTFALGRGVEPHDEPAIERIMVELKADEARFHTLIRGVVNSVPFQMRRGGDSSMTQ